MTLDATIYCDCFEKGLVKEKPNPAWQVRASRDYGWRESPARKRSLLIAFDRWSNNACAHEDGIYLEHHLGHIGLVAALREALNPDKEQLPIIFNNVIYNGVHSGDVIPRLKIKPLIKEVARLDDIAPNEKEDKVMISTFKKQMEELCQAASSLNKPIVF